MQFKFKDRVRGTVDGKPKTGTITTGQYDWQDPAKVYVRWDDSVTSRGYREGHVLDGLRLQRIDPKGANTVNVAQAISRAVDEAQEGAESLEGGLYLEPDESATLRVTEVSAELITSSNRMSSHFWVETSDGQRWRVAVTPEPV